ncbi:hypothetical protein CAEBREN_25813 [Caenorhabditis brenneri]|uniref:Ion transport domain-containing protein n=1 Tax=Caenorhabditis brenneri TaxID=135651 RepID=G0P4S3_CAEBE|nr:hypothetical protein CAEBREN_25813 [Caenorhabditis brenneri]
MTSRSFKVDIPANRKPENQPLLTPEPTEEDKRVAQNKSPIFMNVCEAQTKFLRDNVKKCSKYKFEYGNTAFGSGSIDLKRTKKSKKENPSKYKKILSWQELNNLRVDQEWDTIRHPFVLHFINQKLLDCAGFYTAHIIVATLLFILLSCHIIFPHWITGASILILTFVTFLVLVLKCTAKGRHHLVTPWFALGSAFNILTYAATVAYVIATWVATFDDGNPELKIAVIWIPTLITFSFVFLLVMRGSGVAPWPPLSSNSTDFHNATFEVLQAIAKTSTMMLGEVDANDILETQKWIPSILVLVFEVITVILLMNLMVSLAVGDVNDLKKEAEDTILKIKLNYVIEALQLREEICFLKPVTSKNGLVIHDNGEYVFREVVFGKIQSEEPISEEPDSEEPNSEEPNPEEPNSKKTNIEETSFEDMHEEVKDNWWMIYSKWLIGLDMAAYLKNAPLALQQV